MHFQKRQLEQPARRLDTPFRLVMIPKAKKLMKDPGGSLFRVRPAGLYIDLGITRDAHGTRFVSITCEP
jgi:hypothetical protein